MSALWQLSATEAVDKLRRGGVSPLEMVEAAAERIEAVEPKVNALPIRFLDVAREQAKAVRRDAGESPGWLAGLPIVVKDYNDVAGQLTTYGSPIFANHIAAADDRTVAILRANGAIPLAKSNVPEFAGSHTFNPVWGVTRNPWNPTWGVCLSSTHTASPGRHRIRGSSPSLSCGPSRRITSHSVGPRAVRTTIPHACGAGLGGVGPILGARRVSALVPLGHHHPGSGGSARG